MVAEELYFSFADNLSNRKIQLITNFYDDWGGQSLIPIKFRFIKIFAKNLDSGKSKWYLLHRLINKKRITNYDFPNTIRSVIRQGVIPLRIFHSVTEWLAPSEVFDNPHHDPWIIRSGFIPFENDDSLEISLITAKKIALYLESDYHAVYSGNKSIHIWYSFDVANYVKDDDYLTNAKIREKTERKIRYQIFDEIQETLSEKLDNRISGDTRRVVPIIGTLNAITGKKVMKIENLTSLTKEELLEYKSIYN